MLLILFLIGGLYALVVQIIEGHIVTGMRDNVVWGLYIANFIFFIGISYAGALISGILHLLQVKWRTPIIRIAEIITVISTIIGPVYILLCMGRLDRLHHLAIYGRIQSPIIWDVIIISTYLTISVLLLYISLIPDLAICRDKLTEVAGWKKWFYRVFSVNWQGTPEQYKILHKITYTLAVMVIPVAFAIHTVTSWLFSTTWRPGWDSTNLGPYFVSGALMAGAAVIIVAMFFIRNTYNLKEYLSIKLFDNMGKLLVLLSLIYLYFNINEYLGPAFKMVGVEGEHIIELFFGAYAPMYWIVQIFGLILPIIVLVFAWGRKPLPMLIVSVLVLIGAWVKRYLIVIPSLQHPYLPIQDVDESYLHYIPTWEEWSITLASFAWCLLIIIFLIRLLPVIPIWELKDEYKNKAKLTES